jgi:hypothetical protein
MNSNAWLRRQSQGGPLREGEADFVLFHREFGLLVLEVKGAEVSYDSDLGQWVQGRSGNYHPMKDPIRQAQQNLHKILDLIGQKHFPHGFALVFPDSSLTGCPAGGHSHILLGHDDMPRLVERIVRAARSFAADNVQPLSKGESDAILRALMPRFQIIPKLRNELKQDEERFIQLNQDQMDLLAHMLSTPKLLVEGVAGSGKTLLAVQRALDSASQGLKTLFLCYNKTLAQELRHHLRGSSVDVHHFHELCQQAGIEFKVQQQATAQFWDEDIPEKAVQALEKLPQRRWQSLVIDEGQDFRESWWIVALSLLQDEPNDHIAILYDQAQNLYDTSVPVPQLAKPSPLMRTQLPQQLMHIRFLPQTRQNPRPSLRPKPPRTARRHQHRRHRTPSPTTPQESARPMERPRTSPNCHPLALPMGPLSGPTPRPKTHPQHRRMAPQQSPALLHHQILQRSRGRRSHRRRPTRTGQPGHGLRRTLRRILARQASLAAPHPSPRHL